MKFYDKEGKEIIASNVQDIQQKFIKGEIAADAKENYELVDASGQPQGAYSGTDLQQALNSGLFLATPEQVKTANFLRENQGTLGAAKAFADSALDEFSMGLFHGAGTDEYNANAKALAEEHKIASGLGTAAGFGASLIGGPAAIAGKAGAAAGKSVAKKLIGEAAQATVKRNIAGKVAGEVVEQGINAAPYVVADAIRGSESIADLENNAGEIAESFAANTFMGLGLAGTLKLGSKALGYAGKSVIDTALPGANAQAKKDNLLIRTLQHSSDVKGTRKIQGFNEVAERTGQDTMEQYLSSRGLVKNVGEDFTTYSDRIKEYKATVGPKIGMVYDNLESANIPNLPSISSISGFVRGLADEAGKSGVSQGLSKQLLSKADDFEYALVKKAMEKEGFDTSSLTSLKKIKSLFKKNEDTLGEYDDFISEKVLSPKDLWQQKQSINKYLRDTPYTNRKPLDAELGKIENFFGNEIDSIESKYADSINGVKELKALNREYSMLNAVEDNLKTSMERQASNRTFGLTDYISGASGTIGTGHLLAQVLGPVGYALGGAVNTFTNKWLKENGPAALLKYGNRIEPFILDMQRKYMDSLIKKSVNKLTSNATSKLSAKIVSEFSLYEELNKQGIELDNKISNNKDIVAVESLRNSLNAYAGVSALTDSTNNLSEFFPGISNNLNNLNNGIIKHIQENIPRDINNGAPFTKPIYAKKDLDNFKSTILAVNNPAGVLDRIASGQAKRKEIESIKAIYPSIYNKLVSEIYLQAGDKDIANNYKSYLSQLVGIDMGNNNNLYYYQNITADQDKKKRRSGKQIKLGAMEPTNTGRISQG